MRLLPLLLLLFTLPGRSQPYPFTRALREAEGAWIRSDTSSKTIYLCFTAHEFMEGLPFVMQTLQEQQIAASFFLTGDFVRTHPALTKQLYADGHYVGAHSDKHLLYCDWSRRDSLLVPLPAIRKDLTNNIRALQKTGIPKKESRFFMPPYEWYNKTISEDITQMGYYLVNFTPGTSSNADYTTPDMKNYLSSDSIMSRILRYEQTHRNGLNGFHLLIHVGTDPKRTDKFYHRLPELLKTLKEKGYQFDRFR